MLRMTLAQWNRIPAERKGKITHEYCRNGLRPRYVGNSTFTECGKRLVEGLDYEIVDKYDLV